MENSKEYIEKRNEILGKLYRCDCAKQTKDIHMSQETQAALYIKGCIQDLSSALYSLHELLYGELSDKESETITDAINPISKIVDKYLIDCIDCNMSRIDFREI